MNPRILLSLCFFCIFYISCDSNVEKSSTRVGNKSGAKEIKDPNNSGNATQGPNKKPDNDKKNNEKKFLHDFEIDSCGKCHENIRPAKPHAPIEDCISCHSFEESWSKTISFNHQPSPGSCNECHNSIRPQAPHNQTDDCVTCHKHPKWSAIESFNHNPKPSSCNTCHQDDRPTEPHVQTADCVECHNHPNWGQASFDHDPKPKTCEPCHARPTETYQRAYPNQGPPEGFNENDPSELGSGHLVGLDCNVCHLSPKEGATQWQFTHDDPVVPYCLPCHFNDGLSEHGQNGNGQMNGLGNCYNCHKDFRSSQGRSFDD